MLGFGPDKRFLCEFFHAAHGHTWRQETRRHWIGSIQLRAWSGVTMDEAGWKVVGLDLSGKMNNAKDPAFAKALNRLRNLKRLSFSYGPKEFGWATVQVSRYASPAAAAFEVERRAFDLVMAAQSDLKGIHSENAEDEAARIEKRKQQLRDANDSASESGSRPPSRAESSPP